LRHLMALTQSGERSRCTLSVIGGVGPASDSLS
jgi:hypothetical protein